MDHTRKSIYEPTSKALILTICSFTKKRGGSENYDYDTTIFNSLRNNAREKLLNKRNEVFNCLWKGEFLSQGISAKELEYNKTLQLGQDFGGSEDVGQYLPALARYNGRYYSALGKDGKIKTVTSKHHFLILSGLYGLLKPLEPIQLYSVPIERNSIVQKLWMREDVLTDILLDYIKANQIRRVFDFTSRRDYRDIINWKQISRITGSQVFHCFSMRASGADSLRFFGEFMKDYMIQASEAELMSIIPDMVMGEILFRAIPKTLDVLPKEQEIITTPAEKPVSSEWAWFTFFSSQFFRDFNNLGGVEEKKSKF